jgi:hypothetical protein
MYRKTPLALFLLSGSLLLSQSSLADTQLTFTDASDKKGSHSSTIQIHANQVRMGNSSNKVYTLYDGEKQTLYTINPEVKQYMAATLDSIKKNMSDAVAMQKKMKASMKEKMSEMPEEQRKVLEARMAESEKKAKATPAKIETKPNGKTETLQGLKCEVFIVSAAGKPIKETCIAKEGIDSKDMAQLQSMFDFMKSIAVETAKIRGLPAPDAGLLPNYKGGLAIKTQALPTGAKSELSSISTKTIDDKNFGLPEGYSLFDPKAAASKATPTTAPKSTAPASTTP